MSLYSEIQQTDQNHIPHPLTKTRYSSQVCITTKVFEMSLGCKHHRQTSKNYNYEIIMSSVSDERRGREAFYFIFCDKVRLILVIDHEAGGCFSVNFIEVIKC